jgi:hypothetical protein
MRKLFENFDEDDFIKTLEYIFLDKKYKETKSGVTILSLGSAKTFPKETVGKTFFIENGIGYEFEVKVLDDKGNARYRMIHPFHQPPFNENKMKRISTFKLFEGKRNTEIFPSENFGKDIGMDWIYKEWKLPGTPDEIADKLEKLFDGLDTKNPKKTQEESANGLMSLYLDLLELNPEMEKFGKPVSWMEINDIISGMVSKFNFDDIKFYSKLGWDDKMAYNMKNRANYDAIMNASQKTTGWVLSPTTIARVKKELNIK